MKEKLKNKTYAANLLMKAFEIDDPVNLQYIIADMIEAKGGFRKVAYGVGMNEWTLRLIVWNEEECYRIIRFVKLLKSMGLDLVLKADDGK